MLTVNHTLLHVATDGLPLWVSLTVFVVKLHMLFVVAWSCWGRPRVLLHLQHSNITQGT